MLAATAETEDAATATARIEKGALEKHAPARTGAIEEIIASALEATSGMAANSTATEPRIEKTLAASGLETAAAANSTALQTTGVHNGYEGEVIADVNSPAQP